MLNLIHLIASRFGLQVATIFVGISVATAVLTILALVLMFFMKSTTVFHICGWLQILSGKFALFDHYRDRTPHDRNRSHQMPQIIVCMCRKKYTMPPGTGVPLPRV